MPKKFVEPEDAMKEKLGRLRIGEGDIYDVLGCFIREYGLGKVSENLKLYLEDQAEQAFGEVENNNSEGLPELSKARAFDVCAATAESLHTFAEKYEL